LVWAGISVYSLKGTGMAFFGMYIVYSAGIYLVVRRLSGFRWSKANRQLAFLFVPLVATVFVSWYFLPRAAVAIAGAAITIGAGVYSLKTLCKLIPLERLPRVVQKLVVLFRLASPETIV
jgi:PST family polysaccharide transporter